MKIIEESDSSFKLEITSEESDFINQFEQRISTGKYDGTISNSKIDVSKIIYYYAFPIFTRAYGKFETLNDKLLIEVHLTDKKEPHGCWTLLTVVLTGFIVITFGLRYHVEGLKGLYEPSATLIIISLILYFFNKRGLKQAIRQFKADLLGDFDYIDLKSSTKEN